MPCAMPASPPDTLTAFADGVLLDQGPADIVVRAARDALALGRDRVLVFSDADGRLVDPAYPPPAEPAPGRGRPRLGVVAREVTLLPRHWDWLAGQPGGASAALRRLVDQARKRQEGADRRREAEEAAYRVMTALGGDLPQYEEALRRFYAREDAELDAILNTWPPDIGGYARVFVVRARDVGAD